MRSTKKGFMWIKIAFTCLFILGSLACGNRKEKGEIIARVGNEDLPLAELINEFPAHIKKNLSSVEIREFVLRWINDQILYQEAVARGIDNSSELQRDFKKLKQDLVINKLLESTLDNGITVTEQEIAAYYENNKESFILSEDVVRANHILLETKKAANNIRKRLKKGASFELVSRSTNKDSLAQKDWDLGYFTKKDVIPEISKVVFKMAVNSYSYPIKSEFGYHIIQVVDKQKKGDIKRLETVKDEIKQKLLTKKKQDRYQSFLLQTKSKFKIHTYFQLLDSPVLDSLLSIGE